MKRPVCRLRGVSRRAVVCVPQRVRRYRMKDLLVVAALPVAVDAVPQREAALAIAVAAVYRAEAVAVTLAGAVVGAAATSKNATQF
jgi:hypothetical protein